MTRHSVPRPQGPAEVLEALWRAQAPAVRAFVAARVPREDVDDLVQVVFVKASTSLDGLRQPDRAAQWLKAIAGHVVIDYYRSARRRHEVVLDLTAEPMADNADLAGGEWAGGEWAGAERAGAEWAGCGATEIEQVRRRLGGHLRRMVANLPAEQAAALHLVDVSGMSQVEAARISNVSVSGMKSRVQRGRTAVREAFLRCCRVSRDARGTVIGYAPVTDRCLCDAP